MKRKPRPAYQYPQYPVSKSGVCIQAPLPRFLHTLPILLSIEGQGSGRQGPSPLAPREEPKDA